MTLIIHAVGDGDLGIDILDLDDGEKSTKRKQHREQLGSLIKEKDSSTKKKNSSDVDNPIGALFKNEYPDSSEEESKRFTHSPIAAELEALHKEREVKNVKFILVGTKTGDKSTSTEKTAHLLEKALGIKEVKEHVEKYGITVDEVTVEIGDLREGENLKGLRDRLESEFKADNSSKQVLVNAFSGSTMVVFALMGLVDQIGFDWEIAVPSLSESGEFSVILQKLQQDESSVFYWLRSLGYLEQAKEWAEEEGHGKLIDADHEKLVALLEVLKSKQEKATSRELAAGGAVSMLRGDNGAGLLLRAWLEREYEEKLEKENGEECKYVSVFKAGGTLGQVMGRAEERLASGKASKSDKWLLKHEWINDAGIAAVHKAAAPTVAQIDLMRKTPELGDVVPKWMPWPFQRPILYIFAMGMACQHPTVPERVLREPLGGRPNEDNQLPEKERQSPGERTLTRLRRAYPGALLSDSPSLPVEFLILHSSVPGSKQAAVEAATSVLTAAATSAWECGQRPPVDIADYGPGDRNELIATSLVSEAVAAQVKLTLENKRPATVVVVGTGQKGAVIGALKAAQEWCGKNAVPLFLQTFVDKSPGIEKPESQFHRIALHRSAKKALLKAALASLRNMNLMSAVRVLGAGDSEMNILADRCDSLRREYVEAVNSKDPDADAATILDVLKVVRWLWEDPLEIDHSGADIQEMSADWETRSKLAVIAAEITSFDKGSCELIARSERLNKKAYARNIDGTFPVEPKGGEGQKSGKEGQTGKSEEMREPITHKHLLRLLYKVRNKLVVLHGGKAPDEALKEYVHNPGEKPGKLNIVVPAGFSYPCLIDEVCKSIEAVAGTGKYPALGDSDWEERYKDLFLEIFEELRKMESQ